MEDPTHQQMSGAATEARCVRHESTNLGAPYSSDTELTSSSSSTSTWDSSYFNPSSPEPADSSFTSSTEALENTPKRRHPSHSENASLSPQVVHPNKKRSREELEMIARDLTSGPSAVTPFNENMKDTAQRFDLQSTPNLFPANEFNQQLQNWSITGDEEVSPRWPANYEEIYHSTNQTPINPNVSAPFSRSSNTGEDYMESKDSPQYQAIAQDLEGILDMREEENMIDNNRVASPQPIRRRWRGLAPVPFAQSSPSEVLLQQQTTYRTSCPMSPLDGFMNNPGLNGKIQESVSFDSGRRSYGHLPPPLASFSCDNVNSFSNGPGGNYYENGRSMSTSVGLNGNNANCGNEQNNVGSSVTNNNTKEIRWKHQTDMLKTKFSNKGQKSTVRGTNDDGPPPLSAKSFITKWKLNV
eukprot:TRINITY_DN6266_c0_g1_i1.p1 TRINITY_DN6266_c0_g1~~TRINITY_DN6266_c0_g1_i1.p1  ORF type:complete len:459 (+),score=105.80 TRINITY_DN6266_c0_g1_i1:141-1379(+)